MAKHLDKKAYVEAIDAENRIGATLLQVDVQPPFPVDVTAPPPPFNPITSGTSVVTLTGTPAGPRSLIVSGPWVKAFFNACGKPVTIKATGADPGITIAPGLSAALWSDGVTARTQQAPPPPPPPPPPPSSGIGLYGARPLPGNAGNLYVATDGLVPFIDDGTEWRPLIRGVPGFEPCPNNVATAWTRFPGGSSVTLTPQGGSAIIAKDAINAPVDGINGFDQPYVAGKTATACWIPFVDNVSGNGHVSFGQYLRYAGGVINGQSIDFTWSNQQPTGASQGRGFTCWMNSGLLGAAFNNGYNGDNAVPILAGVGQPFWTRIRDDGAGTLHMEYSFDGSPSPLSWYEVGSTVIGAQVFTRAGLYVNPFTNPCRLVCLSFVIA